MRGAESKELHGGGSGVSFRGGGGRGGGGAQGAAASKVSRGSSPHVGRSRGSSGGRGREHKKLKSIPAVKGLKKSGPSPVHRGKGRRGLSIGAKQTASKNAEGVRV